METGKVRFVYRHFIVISEESLLTAMGTECAAEQDMFWEFHDSIFDNWEEARTSGFSVEWLKATADGLELDAVEFDECMQSGRAFERVRASHFDGIDRGVNSTPTVLINGNRVGGDYEAYRQAIENALRETH